MRTLFALTWMPSTEEIQLFCAACMVIPFAVVLLCVLGMLVSNRLNRHSDGRTGHKPPRALPPPGN